MISNLEKEETKKAVSNFKDPFAKGCIDSIDIEIRNPSFFNKTGYKARIRFKNGDTSGQHDIKGADFPDLINQIEEFVNEIEKSE